jgi:hypothetical protein
MDATTGFLAFLALTLVALGATVATGLKARVRPHIGCVVASVVLLGTTIWFAEQLGAEYDLETAGWVTPVHLALAKLATLSYLLPIASGWATLRDRRRRRLHLVLALTTLLLTVAAAATGTAMILVAEPLAAGGGGAIPG